MTNIIKKDGAFCETWDRELCNLDDFLPARSKYCDCFIFEEA